MIIKYKILLISLPHNPLTIITYFNNKDRDNPFFCSNPFIPCFKNIITGKSMNMTYHKRGETKWLLRFSDVLNQKRKPSKKWKSFLLKASLNRKSTRLNSSHVSI